MIELGNTSTRMHRDHDRYMYININYSFSTTSLGAEYILFRLVYREMDSTYNIIITCKSGNFVACLISMAAPRF